jgi:hypothetical protein
VQIFHAVKSLRFAAVLALSIITAVPAFVSTHAQAKPATAPELPPVKLQPFTAQDQSVSAGVPFGWSVKSSVGGSFNLSGPNGETVSFADVFVAHNGPFQLGQKGPGAAVMSMPISAKLTDKLIMFLQQQNLLAGQPVPQVKFTYAAPLQMPPNMGQCGMFAVDFSGTPKPTKGMGVFCALPPDSAQFYKLFLFISTAPSEIAAQTVPTIAAIYKSYKIAPGWMQRMLSPYTRAATWAAPGMGGGASPGQGASADEVRMYMDTMNNNQRVIDHGYRCTAANILGDGSNWETPRECGGWAPNFYI